MSQEVRLTTCPLDCPDTCTLEITVEDQRMVKLDGVDDVPHTGGFICGKVRNLGKHVYGEARIAYPQRRVGAKGENRFERISWDAALTEICDKLTAVRDQFGGEAILPYSYGGSNGMMSHVLADDLLFARLGASRLDRTICAAPTTAALTGLYGRMVGTAFEDFVHAKFILIWGANPKATSIHMIPFLKEAKRRGAFIAVIDPQRHFSDKEIDMHLFVRPGADLPLALAMIRHWKQTGKLDQDFIQSHTQGVETLLNAAEPWTLEAAAEKTGVPVEQIRELADRYADASPALVRMGWGQERNINGTHASAAILAMPALLGKFGVRGGGYTGSNSAHSSIDVAQVLGPLNWNTRILNMTPLADHLLDAQLAPAIKALFVYNMNPVATCPHQNKLIEGLKRDDLFTVVFDAVHTDTCTYADIILPATTFVEHYDLKKAYGNLAVGGVVPVIPRYEEARPNLEVFCELGRRLGFDDAPFTWDEETYFRKTAEAVKVNGVEADVDLLLAGKQQRAQFAGQNPIHFVNIHPGTDDQKVHLDAKILGDNAYGWQEVIDPKHPLAFITPASGKLVTSTFGQFNLKELAVRLHPDEAAQRGLEDGQDVRVYNDLGEVVCKLSVTDRIARGTAMMPKGAWRKSSRNGKTGAALCPTNVEATVGGACFNDARIEIASV